MSVRGWLNNASITFGGQVQTSAPRRAASTMCIGPRVLATSTSVDRGKFWKMSTIWATRSIPGVATSSSRPTNGLTNAAPTLAASRAWAAEKTSVTLTRIPSSVSSRHARTPGLPNGTLTTMCGSMPASSRPSRTMPAASAATTSALTGTPAASQMRFRTARGSAPVFASSEGLVVTPSMMPSGTRASISATSAVSANSFMAFSERRRGRPRLTPARRRSPARRRPRPRPRPGPRARAVRRRGESPWTGYRPAAGS